MYYSDGGDTRETRRAATLARLNSRKMMSQQLKAAFSGGTRDIKRG